MSSLPPVSIGLPVYNGEQYIRKRLDSILSQTYQNYELIISDDGTTDSTIEICEEYAKKDKRIQVIRRKGRIGIFANFELVLNSAKYDYFVWVATDDWWESTFLEKNLQALHSNKKFVGSVSKIDYYDVKRKNVKWKQAKILNYKIKRYDDYDEYFDLKKYEDRVAFYLRLNSSENMYGLFRTSILKKCVDKIYKKVNPGMDLKLLIYIQKFGEINLIDEVLLHRSGKGVSSRGSPLANLTRLNDLGIVGTIFPFLSISIWFLKNFGIRIFLKNFDYLLSSNLSATITQLKIFLK